MKKTALITGASSGIGLEFSKIFAKNGFNLILVSRNENELRSLAAKLQTEFHNSVEILAKDLSKSFCAQELFEHTMSMGVRVDVLVNNAGAGLNGKFTENKVEEEIKIIQLNIVSLVLLCGLYGREMSKQGAGNILNVASTAAYQAGPLMSNYYASKAYVLMFSEGLHNELKKDGVVVTTLCPGPTQTEFFERAKMTNTLIAHVPYMLTPEKVAKIGYTALQKGKRVVVVGLFNKLMAFSTRFTPRGILASIARFLNQKGHSCTLT